MGKLNIAHHKSYHPYKAENIQRVRRDEEQAAAAAAGDQARVMQADSESRISMLRKKSKKGKSREEDQAQKALEKQLKGKGKADDVHDGDEDEEQQSRATIVRESDYSLDSITTEKGHLNFWADLEKGIPTRASKPKTNAEYEAEKKAAQDKWDSQITMYIQAPPKSWYDSRDGLNHSERSRTIDQKLEHTYKDNELKRSEDPLELMQAYLKRRDEVKVAQERQKADPWSATPRELAVDRTPVQASLLSKRYGKGHHSRRSPSPEAEVAMGPPRPSSAKPPPSDIHQAAGTRESSERDRAKALIAAKKREAGSVASTPRSEFGYQTGMYNRNETRQAKNYSNIRWDEGRRGR